MAEEEGDSARAMTLYKQVERLWAGADPDVRPLVAEVRRKIGG